MRKIKEYTGTGGKEKALKNKEDGKVLYCRMINSFKSCAYFWTTYEEIYKKIVSNEEANEGYKNNYFEMIEGDDVVKLYVDIDDKSEEQLTNAQFEIECDKRVKEVTTNINNKLKEMYNIHEPKYTVLYSSRFDNVKISLHIIYENVLFKNVYHLKNFMSNIPNIDKLVYKKTAFRSYKCMKYAIHNTLLYYKTNHKKYKLPKDDYELFLNTQIVNTKNIKEEIIECNFDKVCEKLLKESLHKETSLDVQEQMNNYTYYICDETIEYIKDVLNNIDVKYLNDYQEWCKVMYCIKDLYININNEDNKKKVYQKKLYKVFDEWSSKSDKYDKNGNKKIFNNAKYTYIHINTLLEYYINGTNVEQVGVEDEKYIIPRYYDYMKLSFNENANKLKKINTSLLTNSDEMNNFIENDVLKTKLLFIKSQTGTAKTKSLINILNEHLKNDEDIPILSIVSRVNLGYEINQSLPYMKMYTEQDYQSTRLIVQLDSILNTLSMYYEDCVLILDEVNSLLDYMRSQTLYMKRRDVFYKFLDILRKAKYIICLDADLCNYNINFIKNVTKIDNELVIYNEFKCRNNIDCYILDEETDLIKNMLKQMMNGEHFIASFDSKNYLEKVVEMLMKELNDRKILYNNETYDKYIKIYTADYGENNINTNDWINKWVFHSPKIIYGVSYTKSKVSVYSVVTKNHLTPLHINQQLQRGRDQKSVYIYCSIKKNKQQYRTIMDVRRDTCKFLEKYKNIEKDVQEMDEDDNLYRMIYEKNVYYDDILKSDRKYYLLQILKAYGYNVIMKNDNVEEKYKIKLSKLTHDNDVIEDNEVKAEELEKELKIIEENKEKMSTLDDEISSITFTTFDSDLMMKKRLKSKRRSKLDGICESEKVKSREERVREIIHKKYGDLNNFEKSLIEEDKKLVHHLNFRNLICEDNVFEKKYDSEYRKEFKEEYKDNELLKMRLIKEMMKKLNVTLSDINVNIINRYEENIEENNDLKNLKCVISKTFRLKNVKDNFKDNYFMLIKMIDTSCGIISNLKRKKKMGIFIGYYDLNKDYEEHMKIIGHIEGKCIEECEYEIEEEC